MGVAEPRDAAGGGRDPVAFAAEIRRRLGPAPQQPTWPLVSIVVPNRDGAEHLRRLLQGLTESTDYPALELIVVDNASSDDSVDFLRAVEAPFPISILANVHNESFADTCNQGAEAASGELLLFLNNDAVPFERGWLRELVACLGESGAGAVGPTLVEPSDDAGASHGYAVQQRGLWLRDLGGLLAPGYRDQHADPLGEILGEDAWPMAVIAACLLIERRRFEQVGGFTSGYWYGPEDLDLSLKLRERGLPPACSGRSILIHPPGSTLKTVDRAQLAAWLHGNRRLFMERWGPRVRRELELDRLRGGGLWAEPGDPGPSPTSTSAEWEKLGFCLAAAAPHTEDEALLGELRRELRRRGHRCLTLRGEEVESLAGLDYDVAVHVRRRCRYVPKPAQLNVLLCTGRNDAVAQAERRRYDLVLNAPAARNEASASALVSAIVARAEAVGFATRIDGTAAPHAAPVR
ncbi:MAG: glycosyltransferase [Solirubrobacterales bacterium]